MMYIRDGIDAQAIRQRLGKKVWEEPQPFGEDGWMFLGPFRAILVTLDPTSEPGVDWIHASIGYMDERRMPSYSDLKQMHAAVFPGGHAYQAFVPPEEHVNIKSNVLHLWGRADGATVLPPFGRYGSI